MSTPNSRSESMDLLTPESRTSLQLKLNERRKELEEKRQKIHRLQKQEEELSAITAPSAHETAKAQLLLNEIRQKMSDITISPAVTSPSTQFNNTSITESPRESLHMTKETEPSLAFKIQKFAAIDTSIVPKVVTTFDKSIQADLEEFDEVTEAPTQKIIHIVTPTEEESYTKKRLTIDAPTQPIISEINETVEEPPAPVKELTTEQKSDIIKSRKFQEFFENSSKMVERTLGVMDIFDVMTDITGETGGDIINDDTHKLKRVQKFYDANQTQGRHVNDIRCSKNFEEIFLTAFGSNKSKYSLEPNGCVLIWNSTMAARPEYVLTYQSEVCAALFNTFQPKTIIGATYSGAIVLWDLRARSKPVQRTPFSSEGHLFPVYAAELLGTQNANNLVTMDTDGKVCQWSLSMMNKPTEMGALQSQGHKMGFSGCFAFPEGEINLFMGGMVDGTLFQAQITGSNAGMNQSFESHTGPLTDTHFHPSSEGHMDFTDLLLTSSLDWTVNLWSPRNIQKPLHTFEYEDMVYNAKWHPSHPSIFATSEAAENISIWNLNSTFQEPVFTASADNAVNKLCWSNDGKRLYTGDKEGEVLMWAASNDIAQCKNEDWDKMINNIKELKNEKKTLFSQS